MTPQQKHTTMKGMAILAVCLLAMTCSARARPVPAGVLEITQLIENTIHIKMQEALDNVGTMLQEQMQGGDSPGFSVDIVAVDQVQVEIQEVMDTTALANGSSLYEYTTSDYATSDYAK